jgi:hypothetical protein
VSEFLDELARSMAKSMPRSKAVRLLGGAVVTAAVPLLRTAPGSGASTRPVQYPAPKKCADYSEGPTCPKLCCRDCPPIPSGGNPGVLRWCCNTDDECNFEAPSAQYRCGRVGCRKKKVCGPDISNALEDALARTRSTFAGWSSAERSLACVVLVETPVGAVGWEINQLGPGNREQGANNFKPDCATCGGSLSVQVGSGCHYAGSVNYVVYGAMLRLCHDHMTFDRPFFTEQQMAQYITVWKSLRSAPNLAASLAWAKAGYNGWPNGPTPRPELPNCAKCPKRLTSRLTVRWLPLDRNI